MRTRSSFFASLKLSRFFDGRLAKPRAGAATTTDAAPTRDGRAGSSRRDGGAQSGGSGEAQAARLRAQLRRQQAGLPLIIVGEGRRSATRAAVVYRAATAVSIGSSSSLRSLGCVCDRSATSPGSARSPGCCSTIVEGPVRPLHRAVLTRFRVGRTLGGGCKPHPWRKPTAAGGGRAGRPVHRPQS